MRIYYQIIKYTLNCLLLFSIIYPNIVWAESANGKLANYYLKWQINNTEAIELAKWDLLIMDLQNQFTSREALLKIRELNPQVKILAYVTANEVQKIHAQAQLGNPWRDFYDYAENNNLWLYDNAGQKVSFWSAAYLTNVTNQRWSNYLAEYLDNNILNSGLWDGVYLDNSFAGIKWLNPQINITDQEWQVGMRYLLTTIRSKMSANQVLVVNSSSAYSNLLNGRMYENWPSVYGGNWSQNYQDLIQQKEYYQKPLTIVINSNTGNQDKPYSYQKMRFGFSSALLFDAYYSFDYGDQDHARLWWYDEYNQYLGEAKNKAQAQNGDSSIWSRDYEQALVLLNSSNNTLNYELDGEYEKIKGQQDRQTNSGEIVNNVTLSAQDGLILLRRIQEVNNALFLNGSFIKSYKANGQEKRAGFFAYDREVIGGERVWRNDLNKDGQLEKVIVGKNWWQIKLKEQKISTKVYFENAASKNSITVAIADVNNDQQEEIVVAQNSGGSLIKIYNSKTLKELNSWLAFDKKFKGGINIAIGDFDHNGWLEIAATPASSGGPQVKLFNSAGKLLKPGVMLGDSKYRSGLQLAAGDVNGDLKDELITMNNQNNKKNIQIYNEQNKMISNWWYQSKVQGSVDLLTTDVDRDGIVEILLAARNVFTW